MAKYEFDGEKYSKASKHQKDWGRKLIEEIDFKKDDIVLDLGCGDGLLSRMIKDIVKNGYVLGIDASEGMILKAKEYQVKGLEFRQLDINDIDFEDMFTVIVSNATLHWVKDHSKLLWNCHKALKKCGILRFNFAGGGNCPNFIDVVKKQMQREKFNRYFNNFEWPWYMPDLKDYEKLIGTGLFSEFKIWGEEADRYFKDSEEMIKWLEQPSLVPFLKNIAEPEPKENFTEEVEAEMIKRTELEDGRCFEPFRRINVYAKK
ncbi:MAG: methyltransferase domain-containing protein [candidate division WOR-3 bacterium]|jgi:trans-aconitate 2-methyltransferase